MFNKVVILREKNDTTNFLRAFYEDTGNKYSKRFRQQYPNSSDLNIFKKFLRTGKETAPVKIMHYTVAGGAEAFPSGTNKRKPIFEDPDPNIRLDNPYEHKFIVLDEIHSFLEQDKAHVNRDDYWQKVEAMRNAGCTATPLVEGKNLLDLLDIVRGEKYKVDVGSPRNDEGFVSCMLDFPAEIYPEVYPGLPLHCFPNQYIVPMYGLNLEAFKKKKYTVDYSNGLKRNKHSSTYSHSAYNKFFVIAHHCRTDRKKTVILINKNQGAKHLFKIMQQEGISVKYLTGESEKDDGEILQDFEDKRNNAGEIIQVLIADIGKYGTGKDFIAQKLVLVNVPATAFSYVQYLGRVLRSCNYQSKFPGESHNWVVELVVYKATLTPLGSRRQFSTTDEKQFDGLQLSLKRYRSEIDYLKQISVDHALLKPLYDDVPKSTRRDIYIEPVFNSIA
jgi:hypothetical protein